ncbi:MAG TPA: SIR2 family protein [Actinomycetes bacterium]|nr:SIR2 family protein [Actinomycetes bacterium]
MRGHVFVVRGDVRRLVCDAWLLPTDARPYVTPGWFAQPDPPSMTYGAHASWLGGFRDAVARVSAEPFRRGELVRVVGSRGPSGAVPVLTQTATAVDTVDWDHVRRALAAFVKQAKRLDRSGPAARRRVPLLAVPAVGTGAGGGAAVKGEAVERLLHLLADEADGVDVALVLTTDAMAAAARSHRRRPEHRLPFERELGGALLAEADRLALRARSGEVVLFTGAGTGVPAGLPTWDGLLRELAGGELFSEPELRELSALDKAAIIERRIGRQALVDAIARAVGVDSYALGHALLANLPIGEAATLNYDELFETAAHDAGRRLAVLPYERPGPGYDGWLLKMHGCVRPDRREDIVLTRADYLTVGQHRAALTGLLQAMLVTRHMLFVGFGLTDEHFHAVIHDVRRALLPQADAGKEPFGTALVLRPQRAAEMVWSDDLYLLPMSGDDPPRRLEIFLDWLANESDQGWQHVLDDSFASILEGAEVELKRYLEQLVAARPVLEPGGAWPAVTTMLARFGWSED